MGMFDEARLESSGAATFSLSSPESVFPSEDSEQEDGRPSPFPRPVYTSFTRNFTLSAAGASSSGARSHSSPGPGRSKTCSYILRFTVVTAVHYTTERQTGLLLVSWST